MKRKMLTTCCKGSFDKSVLSHSLNKFKYHGFELYPFELNTEGLSKRYNQAIEECIRKDIEHLVMVHDDVKIIDTYVFEKIEDGLMDFDIIGVAGTSVFKPKVFKPHRIAWHTCCNRSDYSGGCLHPMSIEARPVTANDYYWTEFGKFGKSCVTVDGLFICVNIKKLGDVRFDERFNFDFYDLDFCINAVKSGLKIGTVPIMLSHESHGVGLMSDRYAQLQEIFNNKWNIAYD